MATMLGLNVGIGADVGGLVAGANLARGEINKINKMLQSARGPAGEFNDSMDLLNKAFDRGAISAAQHRVLMKQLEDQFMRTAMAAEKLAAAEAAKTAAMEKAAAAAAAAAAEQVKVDYDKNQMIYVNKKMFDEKQVKSEYDKNQAMWAMNKDFLEKKKVMDAEVAAFQRQQQLTTARIQRQLSRPKPDQTANMMFMTAMSPQAIAASMLIGKAIQQTTKFEQQMADLEVLAKDADKARIAYEKLRKVGAESPLKTDDFINSTRVMMQFGQSIEEATAMSIRLSDIAGSDADAMFRLARAYGQAMAQGRLLAQDRNQMIEAGFNPLQSIAEMQGKQMTEVIKDMEQGRISAKMVTGAFIRETSKVNGIEGKFFGRTAKLADTLGGSINQLVDQVDRLFLSIGKLIGPSIQAQIERWAWQFEMAAKVIDVLAKGAEGLRALFQDLANLAQGGADKSFENSRKFIDSFSAAAPAAQEVAKQAERISIATQQATESAKQLKEAYAATLAAEANSLDVRQKALQPLLDQIAELRGEGQQTRMLAIANEVYAAEKARVEALKSAGMEYAAIEANAWKVAEAAAAEAKAYEDTIKKLEKQNELLQTGKQLMEQFADPSEKIRQTIKDVLTMLNVGAIDPRTGARAILESINQNTGGNTITGTAGSFSAGSMEAAKFILQRQGDKDKRAYEEQKKVTTLMETLNITQQEALRYLQKLQTVGVIK